jgi:hypothetical protein
MGRWKASHAPHSFFHFTDFLLGYSIMTACLRQKHADQRVVLDNQDVKGFHRALLAF